MGPTPHSRPASAFGPARRRAVAASWAQGVQLGLGHLQHPQAERDASPGPPQAGCPERLQPHVVPGASGAARTVYSAVAGTQGVGCGCRPLSEYAAQYNDHRPHQSRDQLPPALDEPAAVPPGTETRRRKVIGGIINEYTQAA